MRKVASLTVLSWNQLLWWLKEYGRAAESHPTDGLKLEFFSISPRYTQPLVLPVGIGIN